jgi:ferredoxin-thioredoxin reductase catalytic chain
MNREIIELYEKLKVEAEAGGYHLNPDEVSALELVEGLAANLDRYGYMSCPCRLADGERSADLDIICPCDYRDADLSEFGSCY